MYISIDQHNKEIKENLFAWNNKPLLRTIYQNFYEKILRSLNKNIEGEVVELGSGIGNFKSVYPQAIATDIFQNPWIDRVESAYSLTFSHDFISNLIMFDVFHHLAYPGSALEEAKIVLVKGGRLIIFEPYISLLGLIVYGIFHHEPVALFKEIKWTHESGIDPDANYYAAEGNATRIFGGNSNFQEKISKDWNIVSIKKYSALSYVLSGGFSKPALYPIGALGFVKKIEKLLDFLPVLFATRILIVLEKK